MAIEDYIPNIFGGVPTGYQGLLGEQQASALSKRANLAGLLGFGAALAQGMSPQGYRRSALENILSAAGAGFGGAGQAYESGLKNIISQQQFALQQRQVAGINAMKQKYPDLADEFDTNPAGAFRLVAEREQARLKPLTVKKDETVISPSGQVIFRGETAKAEIINPDEATALGLPPNAIYQRKPTGEIELVSGTAPKVTARTLSPDEAKAAGLPTNRNQVWQIKPDGSYDLIQGTVKDLEKFSGDYANVALELFGTSNPEDLTAQQRSQVGKIAQSRGVEKTPKTSVTIAGEKFAGEFGKGVAGAVETTFNRAQAAQNTISTINTIKPIIQEGVYSGPLSGSATAINRLASSFGISSGTTEEKLQRTSQAMQGLASLELQAAEAMKGQGAITDFERTLIARAAGGDLQKLTQKEVVGLLGALEKVAKKKIETHKTNLERLRKRPDTRELADFYELGQSKPQKFVFDPASGSLQPKGE